MKRFFDEELETYRSHISRMLMLTHQQTQLAVEGLLERNKEKCVRVLEIEKEVDHLELELDSEAIRYLNLRAPIASELRLIMAGSKMSHEFERIGDEAKKIAKRAARTDTVHPERFVSGITEMFDILNTIFEGLHNMFSEVDSYNAFELIKKDALVDQLHKSVQESLLQSIEEKVLLLKAGFELISVSRSLERIGDHLQNILETTVFLITGEDIREE